jgi:hypothetical protein
MFPETLLEPEDGSDNIGDIAHETCEQIIQKMANTWKPEWSSREACDEVTSKRALIHRGAICADINGLVPDLEELLNPFQDDPEFVAVLMNRLHLLQSQQCGCC